MTDLDALLAKAQPRTEEFRLLLDLGDGALEDYDALVDAANAATTDADKAKAKRKVAKANEALAGHELHGKIRCLPLLAWEELKGTYPPRDGVEVDLLLGVDLLHLPDIVRACIVEPSLSDAQWARLVEVVPAGEWRRLADQVFTLNERAVSVPKLPGDFLAPSSAG